MGQNDAGPGLALGSDAHVRDLITAGRHPPAHVRVVRRLVGGQQLQPHPVAGPHEFVARMVRRLKHQAVHQCAPKLHWCTPIETYRVRTNYRYVFSERVSAIRRSVYYCYVCFAAVANDNHQSRQVSR